MDPYKILLYPLVTEKTMDQTDKENKLAFVVSRNANKNEIKEAVEKMYKVKVSKVNTVITHKGVKKALIQLKPEFSTEDILSKSGVV